MSTYSIIALIVTTCAELRLTVVAPRIAKRRRAIPLVAVAVSGLLLVAGVALSEVRLVAFTLAALVSVLANLALLRPPRSSAS